MPPVALAVSAQSDSSALSDLTRVWPDALAELEHVWRAGELGDTCLQTMDTGYAQLDAALPGGGWPQGAMTEVLQGQAGVHEWGLVAPALAAIQVAPNALAGHRMLVLVGAPHAPFGPALGARQLDMPQLLCVRGSPGNAPSLLWATREALQCADVAAVLAWLPDARSAHLRRLQIAAHAHNKLLFVFRPLRAQHESSPAPLRLLLEGAVHDDGLMRANVNMNMNMSVRVTVLKRRGPPLASPILLDTRPARLAALLAASRERLRHQREEALESAPVLLPATANPSTLLPDLLTALVRGPAVTTSADGRAGLTVSTTLTATAIGAAASSVQPTTTTLYALLDRLAHLDRH